jgi:iron complex outermembrane receptor protein
MIRRKLIQPGIVLSAITAIVVSPLALAAGEIEEIIVTASKRAENIQDVSVAVTAIDSETIERLGIIDITGLEQVVPGLRVGRSGSEVRPAMRGARTNDVGVAGPGIAEQTVGIFLDGIYVPTTTAGLGAYVDVNRIEVLRGPQGTLYGRNTFAGSINVISNAPDFEGISGSIKATVGDYNRAAYEGVLNLPLSDTVATRLVIAADSHDGMITNHIIPGAVDDLREKNQFYARVVTDWNVSDDFSATLRFDYSTKDSNSEAIWGYQQTFGYQITETVPGSGIFNPDAVITPGHIYQLADATNTDTGPYDVYRNGLSLDEQSSLSTTLILDWSTDFADIRWTNNYTDMDGEQYYDSDYSDGNCDFYCGFGRGDQQKSVSSELQLTSNNDGPLSWVGGLYYFSLEADWNWLFQTDTTGDGSNDTITAPSWGNSAHDPHDVDSIAVYGQVEFAISDTVRLIGGLRYNDDEKSFTGTAVPDWDDTAMLWKAAVEFDVGEDMMLYASGSTGIRSGGANDGRTIASGAPVLYDNEEVTSYEVGAKTRLLDGAMTLNVAAYINTYEDVKAQVFAVACNDPTLPLTVFECVAMGMSTTFEYYENGGDIDTTGVEVEMQWVPTDNLYISGTLAWLDAEFASDYLVGNDLLRPLLGLGNLQGRQDINDPTSRFSFAGWAPALAPEYTVSLAAAYDIQLSGGSVLTPSISLTSVDDYYAFDVNIPEVQQDAYTNVDARLTWTNDDKGIAIDAFVMNATDEQVLVRAVVHSQIVNNLPANSVQANWNNPRTWGVSFRYSFD